MALAKIFAKLFPISMDDKRISGLWSSLRALLAPLRFFDIFLSFTLFDAMIPVSAPEENAENMSKNNNVPISGSSDSISKVNPMLCDELAGLNFQNRLEAS